MKLYLGVTLNFWVAYMVGLSRFGVSLTGGRVGLYLSRFK